VRSKDEKIDLVFDESERAKMEEELKECFAFAVEDTDGADFEVICNMVRHSVWGGQRKEVLRFLHRAAELNPDPFMRS